MRTSQQVPRAPVFQWRKARQPDQAIVPAPPCFAGEGHQRMPPRPLLRIGRGGRSRSDREHYEPASLSVRRGGPTGLLLVGSSANRAPKCSTHVWTRRFQGRFRATKPKTGLRIRVCHVRTESRAHVAPAYVSANRLRCETEQLHSSLTHQRSPASRTELSVLGKRATSHAVCGVARQPVTPTTMRTRHAEVAHPPPGQRPAVARNTATRAPLREAHRALGGQHSASRRCPGGSTRP